MGSIGRKNNNVSISSKDLKKAIVERNNSLKRQNNKISSIIEGREKELKSLEDIFSLLFFLDIFAILMKCYY